MEIPLVEIEALCAYVEINIEMGVEMNSQDWRQSTQKVRAWLDAAEQKRVPDVSLCACPIFRPSAFSESLICRNCGKPPRR